VFEHTACDNFPDFIELFNPFMNKVNEKIIRIGYCFDTAHIFNSGTHIEDLLIKNKFP
jgi:endonuclease IV